MRHLILLLVTISMVSAMGYIGGNRGSPKKPTGDWPSRFPQHPAGFSYKCKNRQFETSGPSQNQPPIGNDGEETPKPTPKPTTTTTVKPTSPTTLKMTSPTTTTKKPAPAAPTATTFWIRSPTPPNTPAPVVKGGAAYTLGHPQFATVKPVSVFAPDAALHPLNGAAGNMDFDIKPVGVPKGPRAVIDPDA
ncbi:uncharacterized protein CELE_C48B4.12 [Caenorhabditis elegans]|uniref:Secreted protein n=1 Tax=Caenorhabditis elegans TaxID=6239 RepID=G5ECQ6_CAEEL|nr:Secreted protein [Caenorhabditis elegans]CAA82386.1 Secreted protein [Caenorhabditis elegans]|eukprot:NP_499122.1 Uncharacterized protein CELE_C48B4.12 [Caenorhabditis elegans]